MNCIDLQAISRPRITRPRQVSLWSVVMCATLLVANVAPAADGSRLATRAELRQMLEAGEYRACLQQIARLLQSDSTGKSDDRYELLLMRGDCLLQLDDPSSAQLAYALAARSPLAEQARQGRAMTLLIQRSRKMTYLPRSEDDGGHGPAPAGIDLASSQRRPEALRALLSDELRAEEPAFRRAVHADNLVPIREVLSKLADLYAIELTATGRDVQMRPILESIGGRARTLIEQELDLREEAIAAMERRANQRVNSPSIAYGWWGGEVRRGLRSSDRTALRDLIDYLHVVKETAVLGRDLAMSFDGDAQPWDPLVVRASKAASRAQEVLDAE